MSREIQHYEIFKSGHDIWTSVFIWGTSLLLWLFAYSIIASKGPVGERIIGSSIPLITGGIAPWLWLTTRYRISETSLYLQSGVFRKELKLNEIRGITYKEQTGGYSFALSRDSLHIEVEGSDRGYRVSPADRKRFLKALAGRCEHLEAEGDNLIPKKIAAQPPV